MDTSSIHRVQVAKPPMPWKIVPKPQSKIWPSHLRGVGGWVGGWV